MKKTMLILMVISITMIAGAAMACCGSSWTAPPPPPPPPPAPGEITPAIDINTGGNSRATVYDLTRTMTKDWNRPNIVNDYGVYSFKNLKGVVYFKVETKDGSVYMTRY
jgi:hypothetical protein